MLDTPVELLEDFLTSRIADSRDSVFSLHVRRDRVVDSDNAEDATMTENEFLADLGVHGRRTRPSTRLGRIEDTPPLEGCQERRAGSSAPVAVRPPSGSPRGAHRRDRRCAPLPET